MKNLGQSKLFELLSVFESREWQQFGRIAAISRSERLGRFYHFLNSYYPDFKRITSDRRTLFGLLFGSVPYKDKQLRYLFSDLQREAEEFLLGAALQSDADTRYRLLTAELARRGAGKNYLQLYHQDAVTDAEDASSVAEHFFADFRKEENHLMHYLPQQRRGTTNIGETSRNLDLFYLVKKLQLMCEMVNLKNVMSAENESKLAAEITTALKQGAYADVPAVTAWYRVWLTLTDPSDESHFNTLRDTLTSDADSFPRNELRDLYQYLMNFCIRRINTGDTSYVRTLLEIYQIILDREIILAEGKLSQWDYKNITAIGIRAGEPGWTESFIETYRGKLPAAERENAYTYNRAYFLFNTGQRAAALALLRQVAFNDLYYQLDSRVILLKCYFEDGDEDAFFYHASAFRLFLARNKQISAYQRTVYRNLIRFSSRILQANGNRKKLDAIRHEVEQVKNVADIGWILRKL